MHILFNCWHLLYCWKVTWSTYNFSKALSLLCASDALFALYLHLSTNAWNNNSNVNIRVQLLCFDAPLLKKIASERLKSWPFYSSWLFYQLLENTKSLRNKTNNFKTSIYSGFSLVIMFLPLLSPRSDNVVHNLVICSNRGLTIETPVFNGSQFTLSTPS